MSPWVRYDDTYHDDPRVIAVSLAAVGLLNIALVWASRHLTDGWVSRVLVRQRADRAWKALANELAAAGLWMDAERNGQPGYEIAADLVALQPSRTDVERNRQAARLRQQRARSREVSPASRPVSQHDRPVTNADVTIAVTGVSHDPVPTRPDPDPDPEQGKNAARARFDRFKAVYPKSCSEAAWREWQRIAPNDGSAKQIIASAEAYARHVADWQPRYIKHAHNWLRDRGWLESYEDHASRFRVGKLTAQLGSAIVNINAETRRA